MLRIRLLRTGKKNRPFFRIVVTDKRNPPKAGRFLEVLGFYDPLTKEKGFKKERIEYWLSVGAKPSDSVYNLLVKERVLDGKKIPVHKKSKKKKEAAEAKPEAPKKAEKPEKEEVKAAEATEEARETETPQEGIKEEKKDEKDTA